MYSHITALPQEHFIQISLDDLVFAVAGINDDGHQCFFNFSFKRTFAGQIEVFNQLLSERTAALNRASRCDIR